MTATGEDERTAERIAQVAAAAAIRELAGALVERVADATTLGALVTTVQGLTAELRQGQIRDLRVAMRDSIVTQGAGASAVLQRAVGGPANPTAVPLTMHSTAESVTAELVIDPVFAGWPGWAHGGTVAALIDDVLGQMASVLGGCTATAHLEIDFHRPTPVSRPLRIESRPSAQTNDRIVVEGALFDGDKRLVTGRGTFAVVGPEMLR